LCRRVTELEAVLVQRGGGNVRSGKRERVPLGSDESSRPIVCQGPFSQYRSVVVDSLAYFYRASEVEQFLYKQSFTVNPTGAAFGNTATGKNQVGDRTRICVFNPFLGVHEQEIKGSVSAQPEAR
jgi:hypothetical protein